jgi:hypothetical protein
MGYKVGRGEDYLVRDRVLMLKIVECSFLPDREYVTVAVE